MIMNESRSETHDTVINIKGFSPDSVGKEITLSSREYFWNPYVFKAEWNNTPTVDTRKVSNGMNVAIPPYCVKIFQFRNSDAVEWKIQPEQSAGQPELDIVLPESGFCDMEMEGWVRAFRKGTDKPYGGKLGEVKFSVEGAAKIATPKVTLAGGGASRFILKPSGKPGKVVVKAVCGSCTAEKTVNFKPVDFQEMVVWDFNSGKIDAPVTTDFKYEIVKSPQGTGKALKFIFPYDSENKNHLIDIKAYPKGVPKERIGGVVFDLILPDSLKIDTKKGESVSLQAVLQSTGAYWIPCGEVKLDKSKGKCQKIRLEIPDKKFMKVMDRAFSIIFLISGDKALSGSFYIDNAGFLLRPEEK